MRLGKLVLPAITIVVDFDSPEMVYDGCRALVEQAKEFFEAPTHILDAIQYVEEGPAVEGLMPTDIPVCLREDVLDAYIAEAFED